MIKKILLIITGLTLLNISTLNVAYAACEPECTDTQVCIDNKCKEQNFVIPTIQKSIFLPGPEEGKFRDILVKTILPFFGISMIGIAGGMSLVFLIIAGVRFATAYGVDENVTKAKDQAKYALIGLIISLLAYTIVKIVSNLTFEGNENNQSAQPQGGAEEAKTTYEQYENLII